MKTIRPALLAKGFFAASCLLLVLTSAAFAQTGSSVPVVTIQATLPIATVTNPGAFTIFRAGNTDATLNVWYDIGGTASNGVDYATIPLHLATIPAGATSNSIVITPLTYPPLPGAARTVVLQLTNSPMMNPVNYEIGSPSSATIYIESNKLSIDVPWVNIVTPTNGEVFTAPTNILIGATASELHLPNDFRYVEIIRFFAGTNYLGGFDIPPSSLLPTWPPPQIVWTNPPPGNYILTAVATDNAGISATSVPVNIMVQLPPTNLPPVVNIVSPTSGTVFNAPANISLIAKAGDPDGSVTNLEFFANGADLGRGLPVVLDPPGVNGVTGLIYFFNWQNVPTNNYSLTAVATDSGGLSTTSAPVKFTVQLPPTNLPPVVRIISPPNGSVFRAPVKLPIYAYAADRDDSVASVEFFADGASLGLGHHVVTAVALPPYGAPYPSPLVTNLIVVTNFWELTWTNPPPGTNIVLTAGAADNGGLSTTSAPVLVSILSPLPPPTNRPPIISIVATDPIAIEGTNCWTWPGLVGPAAATWSNWYAANATFRVFTNCGPKNATISVFRFGATNDDFNVAYAIGGTATNGVDYVTLSGDVTIPAGERRADISIMPLDDGLPDITSTVVLKLLPDATGTNYLLGYPRAAAAIILDSRSPRAGTGIVPGPAFSLASAGPDGAWFHVEYSADLVNWTPICTNQVVNGSINFVDPDAVANPARFYRTVPESGPPPT